MMTIMLFLTLWIWNQLKLCVSISWSPLVSRAPHSINVTISRMRVKSLVTSRAKCIRNSVSHCSCLMHYRKLVKVLPVCLIHSMFSRTTLFISVTVSRIRVIKYDLILHDIFPPHENGFILWDSEDWVIYFANCISLLGMLNTALP